MIRRQSQISWWIMDLALMIYFIELVFPQATVIGNSTLIKLACFALWMMLSIGNRSSFYTHIKSYRLAALVFYVATAFLPYIFGASTIAHRYMSTPLIPLGFLVYEYYKETNRLESLRKMIMAALCFAIVTGLVTYTNLIIKPWISRSIKSSGEHSEGLASLGIGGYSYIYFLITASVVLLYGAMKSKAIWEKMIYGSLFVISILIALKANYMTALMSAMISITIYFIASNLISGRRSILRVVLVLVLVWGVLIFSDEILGMLESVLPKRVSMVFYDSQHANVLQSIWNEFLNDRWPTLVSSINAFKDNPIFGMITSGADLTGDSLFGFGQHSYVLDTFALYGVVLGVLSIYVLLLPFKVCKCDKALKWAVFSATAIVSVTNNLTDSIALAFGIIYPYVAENIGIANGGMPKGLTS